MSKITMTAATFALLVVGANRLTAEDAPAKAKFEHRETLRRYALHNKGDVGHGAEMLKETVWCASCHDFRGHSTIIGPSLAEVGDRLSREEIIEQVLEPSRRSRHIQVRFGEDAPAKTFRLVKEDPKTLTVRDDEKNTVLTLEKSSLAGFKPVPSDMPEGQADSLTQEQFADLVEFVVAQKKQ